MYLYWFILFSKQSKFIISEAAKYPQNHYASTSVIDCVNIFFGLHYLLGTLHNIICPSEPNNINFDSSTNTVLSPNDKLSPKAKFPKINVSHGIKY